MHAGGIGSECFVMFGDTRRVVYLAIEVGVARRSADGRDVLLVISIGHLRH